MRVTKSLPAMALSADSFSPIDLGYLALSSIILQCRTAADIYISTDPEGTNYLTLKSGASLSLDLEGGVLDVTLGSEILVNGSFTGNADGWTFNTDDWTYNGNAIDKDQDGVTTLSQVPSGTSLMTVGAYYRLGYTISGAGFVASVTPSVGGSAGTARSATGTYVDFFKAVDTTSGVIFTPSNLSRFTLDTISLKRVTFPGNSVPVFVKGSAGGLYLEMIALQ